MENPFQAPKLQTLREAFPNVDVAVIDDVLWSANGNLDNAFEALLAMSDTESTGSTPSFGLPRPVPAPPLPPRQDPTRTVTATRSNSSNSPRSAHEELVAWRQDLARRSSSNRLLASCQSTTSRYKLEPPLAIRKVSSIGSQARDHRQTVNGSSNLQNRPSILQSSSDSAVHIQPTNPFISVNANPPPPRAHPLINVSTPALSHASVNRPRNQLMPNNIAIASSSSSSAIDGIFLDHDLAIV
ncbi:uncharacterized protein BYT42DRAFT_189665 [Radiomyces spectabilis]|uniref:uncharacterized protein n=1 Tax=Radiomyces spectabilis TaxID=64574 RepID=UPI0022210086|nr:uncharacterized protein BYT42DRAFT_189665 [Radiomyces spectabilis]KAI8391309.1 hypothetical protein BYT42DRAFT_189665 [Radiomyces spectabilis]